MSDSDNSQRGGDGNVTRRGKKPEHVSTGQSDFNPNFKPYNLRVPTFSPDDPEIWFALLEGQFDAYGIRDDAVKFTSVVTNLDMTHAKAVKDIIVDPPAHNRYLTIKSELIKRLTASHEKKVRQLLTHEELGDRRASQFLRHLQDLAGPNVPKEFIQSIWTSRLPNNIQTVLASQPSHSLQQLADLADRIQEITAPGQIAETSSRETSSHSSITAEISELRQMVMRLEAKLDQQAHSSRSSNRSRSHQRRTSSRSGSRSTSSYRRYPLCWYHQKFGSDAKRCVKPCDFSKTASGNATGSR